MSSGRLQEGRAAAKLAYEEGNGLVALNLVVECVVELEARIQQLEHDKLMLQGQLDMSRSSVAGAKAEIVWLEERVQQLEEALRDAHKLLEVAARECKYPSLKESINSFVRRERAVLFPSEAPLEQQYPWREDYGYIPSEAPEEEGTGE